MNDREKTGIIHFGTIVFLFVLLCASLVQAKTYVVFRYDDFAGDGPGVREANDLRWQVWEAERQIDKVFAGYGLQYVIAIIPQPNPEYIWAGSKGASNTFEIDSEKIWFIKKGIRENRIEAAQHGLSHTNHCAAGHRPAEFREWDYRSQFDAIIHGRDILKSALETSEITTFVPPWNGWDRNTAEALGKAGFKILSADRHYYYESAEKLNVVPFTTTLHDFESLVSQGQLTKNGLYVVLYHPFDLVRFPGDEGAKYYFGVDRLEILLGRVSQMPEVQVTTLKELGKYEDVSLNRYKAANALWKQMLFWNKLLPAKLWPGKSGIQMYLSADTYRGEVRFWWMMTGLLACGLFLAGLIVRYVISKIVSSKLLFKIDVTGLLLFCAGVASEIRLLQRGYHLTGIRMIPVFVALGFVIAFIFSFFKEGRREAATSNFNGT